MKFYDLHVHSDFSIGTSSVSAIAKMAKRLGLAGIAVADLFIDEPRLGKLREATEAAAKEHGIDVHTGVELQPKDPEELKRMLDAVRGVADVVIVAGGDYKVNRAACEDARVDILAHPEFGRKDNGLDEQCFAAAIKNNVAIEINFRHVLFSYKRSRAHVLEHIATNIRLANEKGAKLIVCSGANSTWEMRDARQMIAVTNVLGMDLSKAFLSSSEIPLSIIARNRKVLDGTEIGKGIELV